MLIIKSVIVSFDVKPTAFIGEWANVIQVTLGGNDKSYGDRTRRTPSVYFEKSTSSTRKMHICAPVSGNRNCFVTQASYVKNKWIAVKIGQHKADYNYFFTVHIDGVQVLKLENNKVQDFNDLNVYAGSPWFETQPGSIRNLSIINIVE